MHMHLRVQVTSAPQYVFVAPHELHFLSASATFTYLPLKNTHSHPDNLHVPLMPTELSMYYIIENVTCGGRKLVNSQN